MGNAIVSHRGRGCALALALGLVSCGGSQNNRGTRAALPNEVAAVEPAPDVSEVPQPESVVAVLRVPAPRRLVEHVLDLAGYGQLRAQFDTMLEAGFGTSMLALVDMNAPLDAVAYQEAQAPDPAWVFAFGAAGMDDVAQRLAGRYRLLPAANGMRRFQRVGGRARRGGGKDGGDLASAEWVDLSKCLIAPTPNENATRVVCSHSSVARDNAVAFMARTLPRREVPANTITLDLSVATMRARYFPGTMAELERARDNVDRELAQSQSPALADPAVRAAAASLTHELLDAFRAYLDDLQGTGMSLIVGDDRITLHAEALLSAPSAPLLRAMIDATRNQPAVPADLLARLLPDAYLYLAGTLDARPLAPFVTELLALASSAARATPGLSAQDLAVTQAAFDLLRALDQTTYAVAIGVDPRGLPWIAGATRGTAVPPEQSIAAVRNLLAALRRPTAARRMLSPAAAGAVPDLGAVRDLPARDLPQGAYGFRVPAAPFLNAPVAPPAPAPPTARRRRRPVAPPAPTLDVLLVPDGATLQVIVGTDGPALYRQYAANTSPGVEPQYLTGPHGALVAAFAPAGLPNLLRASELSRRNAQPVEQALAQLADRGRTPAILRYETSDAPGGLTRLGLDFDLPLPALRAFSAAFTARGAGGFGGVKP